MVVTLSPVVGASCDWESARRAEPTGARLLLRSGGARSAGLELTRPVLQARCPSSTTKITASTFEKVPSDRGEAGVEVCQGTGRLGKEVGVGGHPGWLEGAGEGLQTRVR